MYFIGFIINTEYRIQIMWMTFTLTLFTYQLSYKKGYSNVNVTITHKNTYPPFKDRILDLSVH